MPAGQYTRDPITKNGGIRPIIHPIGPSIAYVQLSRGMFSLIDADDALKASITNWFASGPQCNDSFYASGYMRGSRRPTSLHRAIMDHPPRPLVVDHINHDTLDNRRVNLRILTYSENCSHRKNLRNIRRKSE